MRVFWILGLLACSAVASAAPKADLWPRWKSHDASSSATVSYADWDRLLGTYVVAGSDGVHRVAYSRFSAADKAALAAFVQRLEAVPISRYAQPEQYAYWINLYNAKTLQVVVERYPVSSIRDIKLGGSLAAQFVGGPWAKKLMVVEGQKLSLDDIEHRILRPIWRDARTHYAVNCASIGCPNLARQAYTPAKMQAMLDEGARAYVNHSRGATVEGGKLVVSSIYRWFIEDFGGSDSGILAHLRRHASADTLAMLAPYKSLDDNGDRYDWALNDERAAPAR